MIKDFYFFVLSIGDWKEDGYWSFKIDFYFLVRNFFCGFLGLNFKYEKFSYRFELRNFYVWKYYFVGIVNKLSDIEF